MTIEQKITSTILFNVVLTKDADDLLQKIYLERNIARENMHAIRLKMADGIPIFGPGSMAKQQQGVTAL